MSDVMAQYDYCRVCGGRLDAQTAAYARRQFERKMCSLECMRADTKARFACCDKAELIPCVCMYAFSCPVHGTRHIGTHD